MPKIPTFTSQARPTAEPTGVTTNLQLSPTATPAGALVKPISQIADYYAREKQISNKVKAGELFADATVDIFNAAEEAELKTTPQEGIDYFTQQYNSIKNKYKSQAINSDVKSYFDLEFSANKNKYVNNILSKTRTNLVTTRVDQVDQNVKSIIATALDGNNFQLNTLTKDVENLYQGLVNDGIISKENFNAYKQKLPNLIEVEQVRKIARNNGAEAFAILLDTKNFTTIQGDERRKLRSEFGTLAKYQSDLITAALDTQVINKSKEFMNKYGSQETYGFSPEELQQYKIGDIEFDNQLEQVNEKIINKQFSFDTNYNINTDVISKIISEEVKNTKTKFLLAGETESKSILERAGNKTINNNDVTFLSDVITRTKNDTLKKQDQQFLNYFQNLIPLLQGNTFLNYFDKEYNSKASNLRQVLHKRYLQKLSEGFQSNDLLSYTSENYIAKDIKNYLPKTSDINSTIEEMVNSKKLNVTDIIPKLEGETPQQYIKRIESGIDVEDTTAKDTLSP